MTEPAFLARADLQHVVDVLRADGYRCIGPQVRDGAIVYDDLSSVDVLPRARDRQAPGSYRLETQVGVRQFAWANGPQALKPQVFASREVLWHARRGGDGGLHFESVPGAAPRTAVLGVRACDLAALRLQDQHFLAASCPDAHYAARRAGLFLIAVNCTHPAATCFCASTGDGPRATQDYDLVLDELDDGFLISAGSDAGVALLARLPTRASTRGERMRARRDVLKAAQCQQRRLPGRNLRDTLFARLDHPRWQDVAQRCLSCGNCTSVCPTCFCSNQTESPSLDGQTNEHVREWDSCFSAGHSYIHGMVIRSGTAQRYRQWLTHKLGGWHDQFGRSGCVGCGRCISWCPVGIDITVEATLLCAGEGR